MKSRATAMLIWQHGGGRTALSVAFLIFGAGVGVMSHAAGNCEDGGGVDSNLRSCAPRLAPHGASNDFTGVR